MQYWYLDLNCIKYDTRVHVYEFKNFTQIPKLFYQYWPFCHILFHQNFTSFPVCPRFRPFPPSFAYSWCHNSSGLIRTWFSSACVRHTRESTEALASILLQFPSFPFSTQSNPDTTQNEAIEFFAQFDFSWRSRSVTVPLYFACSFSFFRLFPFFESHCSEP